MNNNVVITLGILCFAFIILSALVFDFFYSKRIRMLHKMLGVSLFISIMTFVAKQYDMDGISEKLILLLIGITLLCLAGMLWEIMQFNKTRGRVFEQFSLPLYILIMLTLSILYINDTLTLVSYSVMSAISFTIGILILLTVRFSKRNVKVENNYMADIPLESKEELVPSRQQDLIHIKRLLEINNYREPFALMINDDWGTGKTSLINVLMKDLEEEGHYIIFMQPMVWDDQHKMMDYFFSQLESLLYEKGIYTGKNSAFERYANLITQTLNTAHQSAVYGADLWKSFLGNQQPTNYREQKKQLEEDISLLLGEADKHIYLIVDDCDRVDEGVFKQVLMFIKEVVNFRGIDVLFLMDERKVVANDETLMSEYLEKFVNDKYTLNPISYTSIYNYYYNEHIKSLNLENEQVIKVRKSLEKVIENDVTKNKMMNLRKAKLFIRQQVLILTTLENVAKNAQDEKELKSFEANLEAVSETLQSYIQTLLSIKLFYPNGYTEVDKAQFKTILFDDNAKKKEYDIDQEFQEILLNHQKVCKKSGHKRKDTILLIEQVFFELILSARELNERIFKEIRGKEEHFEHLMDNKRWSEIDYAKYPLDKCLDYMKRKGEIDSELKDFLGSAPEPSIYDICFTKHDSIKYFDLETLCRYLHYPNYENYFRVNFSKKVEMEHINNTFIDNFKESVIDKIGEVNRDIAVLFDSSEIAHIKTIDELEKLVSIEKLVSMEDNSLNETVFRLKLKQKEVQLQNNIILKDLLKYINSVKSNTETEYINHLITNEENEGRDVSERAYEFYKHVDEQNSASEEGIKLYVKKYKEVEEYLTKDQKEKLLNKIEGLIKYEY